MAHKLLLADDSITIQKVVELVLAEEDFEIKSVSNGEDAISVFADFNPDIVLADIDMPKVNGYELCEKIKKNPRTSRIPVILLAGAFDPVDEELVRKVGADNTVIKPFESQELISKINASLTMVSAGPAEEMEAELAEEEVLEVSQEAEEESEAVEVAGTEEDLWAMEEISEEPAEIAAEAFEEEMAEVAVESPVEMAEEDMFAVEEMPAVEEEAAPEEVAQDETVIMLSKPQPRVVSEVAAPEIIVPSKEEIMKLIEKSVDSKVSALLATVDIRDAMLSSLVPSLKASMEKILWEIAPDLVEKMLKEIMKDSMSSLAKEVEKVIWETVPDLAGTMISKEIEKIKSEF